jgi:16S rRNA pseudouridine516 synthase
MRLQGEDTPLLPAQLEVLGEREAALTIREGRYHQVRRMFAATGNHVVALRRTSLGTLPLGALPEGSWRVLDLVEREALTSAVRAAKAAPADRAEP